MLKVHLFQIIFWLRAGSDTLLIDSIFFVIESIGNALLSRK